MSAKNDDLTRKGRRHSSGLIETVFTQPHGRCACGCGHKLRIGKRGWWKPSTNENFSYAHSPYDIA